jgi:hypothetical protein
MSKTQSPIQIPGYTYGTSAVAKSPLSEQDFDRLKQSIYLFTVSRPYPARLSCLRIGRNIFQGLHRIA